MQRLPIPVPPQLEEAVGYPGDARYFALYWTPSGDEVVFDDGRGAGVGHGPGFLAFVRHPAVAPELTAYNFGSADADADHWLILDRQGRLIFAAPAGEARPFLRGQWPETEPVMLSQEELTALCAAFRRQVEATFTPSCEEFTASMRRQQQVEGEMLRWLDQTSAARVGEHGLGERESP